MPWSLAIMPPVFMPSTKTLTQVFGTAVPVTIGRGLLMVAPSPGLLMLGALKRQALALHVAPVAQSLETKQPTQA